MTVSAAQRLCYTIASPDVEVMPIAWTGETGAICAALAGLGYGGVEVQVRDPAAFDTAEFGRVLADAGLALVSVSTGPVTQEGLVLTSPDKHVRRNAIDRLKRIAGFAAEHHASVAVGSIRGGSRIAGGYDRAVGLLRDALTELVGDAAGSGVTYLLEPQARAVTDVFNTVGAALAFVGDFPASSLALEVDTFHASAEERSICGALVAAHRAGRLAHIQLGDSNRRSPGSGVVPWGEVLGVIDAIGYAGWLSVEVEQKPSSAVAADQAQRFLRIVGQWAGEPTR